MTEPKTYPSRLEELARFCLDNPNLEDIKEAIRQFSPLPTNEQKAVLSDPECLLRLADRHDLWETEGEAMGFECIGNRIRRAELRDMARRVVAEDPSIWSNQVLSELGFPQAPPPPITAETIATKMRDLVDDLAGSSSPGVVAMRDSLQAVVDRYEDLKAGRTRKEKKPDPLKELCEEIRGLVAEYADVRDADLLISMLSRAVQTAEAA